jgi:SAM-dependent methyltransferase
MMMCPACAGGLGLEFACANCGWRGEFRDGIPVLLPNGQHEDEVVRAYFENYDQIARDDLDAKILDERYIEQLATNFCGAIDVPAGAQICDVGSGKGFLVRKLLAKGAASVTAVDISASYLVHMVEEPGIVPVLADAEALPFVEHFDVIVATDILEHVLNVGSFLYSVNRALRPGGRLYVRVPFRENLLGYSPHFGCPYRFVHLRTYDRALLRQALEEGGFTVRRLWHDGYIPGISRPIWRRGRLRKKLYKWFARTRLDYGGNPAAATRPPHHLSRIFLQPTVVIAAARKVKSLVPLSGGGYGLE